MENNIEKMSLSDLVQAKEIIEKRLENNSLRLRDIRFLNSEKLNNIIAENGQCSSKLKVINNQIQKIIDAIGTKETDNSLIEEINSAADEWVFRTNGEKWSNNDDSAGDNFGSFVSGAKWMLEKLKKQQ